jgi:CheY-like chemotaxis protein
MQYIAYLRYHIRTELKYFTFIVKYDIIATDGYTSNSAPAPLYTARYNKIKDMSIKNILMVEDSPSVIKALFFSLEHYGALGVSAPNHESALLLIRKHKFDAVIMDGNLHGGTALETEGLVKEILEICKGIRIIAFSGNPDSNSRLLAAGCVGAVEKPYVGKLIQALGLQAPQSQPIAA